MHTTVDDEKFSLLYIAAIRSLGEEFTLAAAAIAQNNLSELEKRIAAQQALCGQLVLLQRSCPTASLPPDEREAVRAALCEMDGRKRAFNALLAHSGRALGVLLALCLAYKNAESPAESGTHGKLSCEV